MFNFEKWKVVIDSSKMFLDAIKQISDSTCKMVEVMSKIESYLTSSCRKKRINSAISRKLRIKKLIIKIFNKKITNRDLLEGLAVFIVDCMIPITIVLLLNVYCFALSEKIDIVYKLIVLLGSLATGFSCFVNTLMQINESEDDIDDIIQKMNNFNELNKFSFN